MANTLQDLRREAGYKSAREFAGVMGIPVATYSRYEQTPDKTPLKNAWAIADVLGCSIDAIVGREHVGAAAMCGDMQKFYDDLSSEGQSLFDEFRDFMEAREVKKVKKRGIDEKRRYEAIVAQYERMMFLEQAEQSTFGELVEVGTADEQRRAFELFVNAKADEKRPSSVEEACKYEEMEIYNGASLVIVHEDGLEDPLFVDDPRYNEELESMVEQLHAHKEAEIKKNDEEVIVKIMKAYDRTHGEIDSENSGTITYSVVDMRGL